MARRTATIRDSAGTVKEYETTDEMIDRLQRRQKVIEGAFSNKPKSVRKRIGFLKKLWRGIK